MMDSMGPGFLGLIAPSDHHVSARPSLLSSGGAIFLEAPMRAADRSPGTCDDLRFLYVVGKLIPYFPEEYSTRIWAKRISELPSDQIESCLIEIFVQKNFRIDKFSCLKEGLWPCVGEACCPRW